jgi:hypothetical protein
MEWMEWWYNDQLHRTDGPAVMSHNGKVIHWYVRGKNITDQVNAWMKQKGECWPWDAHTQMEFLLTFT